MNQFGINISRQLAEAIFQDLDTEKQGWFNLENMRKLYNEIPNEFRDMVRDKLRRFVINSQKLLITKEEFLELFPKKYTPCVHIDLSGMKEVQRIKELSHAELQNIINKRLENRPVCEVKTKFIKKGRSYSKPLSGKEENGRKEKGKDLIFVRKAYFSSLS